MSSTLPDGYTIADLFDEDGGLSDAFYSVDDIAKKCDIRISSGKDPAMAICNKKGEVVACIWTEIDEHSYSFDIAVLPSHQGKGLGRFLIDQHLVPESDMQDMYPDAKLTVDVVNLTLAHALARRGLVASDVEPGHWIMMPSEHVEAPRKLPPLLHGKPRGAHSELREHFFHAITPYKLERAMNLSLNALVYPSLAITERPDLLSAYGSILLMTDAKALQDDPHEVYSADIYSPRAPAAIARVSNEKFSGFKEKVMRAFDTLGLKNVYRDELNYRGTMPLHLSIRDQLLHGDLALELRALYAAEKNMPFHIVWVNEGVEIPNLLPDSAEQITQYIQGQPSFGFDLTQDPTLLQLVSRGVEEWIKKECEGKKPRHVSFIRELAVSQWFSSPNELSFNNLCQVESLIKQAQSNEMDPHRTAGSANEHVAAAMYEDVAWWNALLAEISPSWSFINAEDREVPITHDSLLEFMEEGVVNRENNAFLGPNQIRAEAATQLTKSQWLSLPLSTESAEDYAKHGEKMTDAFLDFSRKIAEKTGLNMNPEWMTDELLELQRQGVGSSWIIHKKKMPADLTREAFRLIEDTVNSPNDYFEVKTKGAVPLSRFHCALVPQDLPPVLKGFLEQNGVRLVPYDSMTLELVKSTLFEPAPVDPKITQWVHDFCKQLNGLEPHQVLPLALKENKLHAFPEPGFTWAVQKALGLPLTAPEPEKVKLPDVNHRMDDRVEPASQTYSPRLC